MEILSGLLLAIDKTIGLLKERQVRRQTLFKEVIDPVFIETEKIMSNYDKIFTTLLVSLNKGDEESIKSGLAKFTEDRTELKAVRTKVFRFPAATLHLPQNAPTNRFSQAHEELPEEMKIFRSFMFSALAVSTNDFNTSRSSKALGVLQSYVKSGIVEKVSPTQLSSLIRETHEDAQNAWAETCYLYEKLKLSYSLGVDDSFPFGKRRKS